MIRNGNATLHSNSYYEALDFKYIYNLIIWALHTGLALIRAVSLVGRAPRLQRGGHRFKSGTVHQNT